jgi:hypothetical protein
MDNSRVEKNHDASLMVLRRTRRTSARQSIDQQHQRRNLIEPDAKILTPRIGQAKRHKPGTRQGAGHEIRGNFALFLNRGQHGHSTFSGWGRAGDNPAPTQNQVERRYK